MARVIGHHVEKSAYRWISAISRLDGHIDQMRRGALKCNKKYWSQALI